MAENNLNISGLNFDEIKTNLRNFVAAKPEFKDYDFTDSALNTLLDLLAYNTYYNAFYSNMAVNEAFLDTAQYYDNVASRAKALGYSPTSARSATANVQLIFTNSIANSTFRSITVPKGTEFASVVNAVSYTFVTPQTYVIPANNSNGFAGYITLKEGNVLTHQFTYTAANTQFVLPNEDVDTDSITVTVTTSGNTQTYTKADNILTTNSSSKIFFIDFDRDSKYKVYFGDDVISKKPAVNSTLAISYRVTNGNIVNGANSYSIVGSSIAGQSDIVVSPVGRATGGAAIESIESVRLNAPKHYETQNRSVTSNDYERILLRDNPDISAISVWGGQDNVPPIYGKVFVAAKPRSGTTFSYNRKEQIRKGIMKYNVQAIDVVMTDPTYLYIVPEIRVRYNPDLTTLTAGELASAVSNKVISYESEYLSNFGKSFRYSKFLEHLDTADTAIQGTSAIIRLKKTFVPSLINTNTVILEFNNTLQRLGESGLISGVSNHPGYGSVTSSSFTFKGNTSYFDDNGFGTLRIYYPSTAGRLNRVYSNYQIGTVDYQAGKVTINSFLPSAFTGQEVAVIAAPLFPNIKPVRNEILLMSQSEVIVIDDNTNETLAVARNVDTVGQTATLTTPSVRLYNF